MRPIYISYPDSESEFAHRLVDDLQTVGYVVFMDAVSNPGSTAWANETRRAIRNSGALVMVLSPENGRRTGTRHEGVLALRGNKPFFVIRRTPGELPRYAQGATTIDCSGDYEAGLSVLLAALPPATALLQPVSRPKPQPRPPRQMSCLRQRRVRIGLGISILLFCLVLGIVLGVIPV